jgi:hypothetical protein
MPVTHGQTPDGAQWWKQSDVPMKGTQMPDDTLSGEEAAALGAKLDRLSRSLSPVELEFLKAALGLAAATLWAHTPQSLAGSSLQDLVIDIHEASAAGAISLNPVPLPPQMKGSSV